MAKRGLLGTGTEIKIGTNALNHVQTFSGLGGSSTDLDATCLKDTMKIHAPGLPDAGIPTATYLFDNNDTDSDFRILKGIQDAGDVVPVEVKLKDGTTFSSTAYVTTYIDGEIKSDDFIVAKAELSLQDAWTISNPESK